MSTSKHYDLIAIIAIVVALCLAIFMYVAAAGGGILTSTKQDGTKAYETSLFDTSKVHTIDLAVDDWDSFIENCENEEYVTCDVTIDGETIKTVGLRAKGNTSLSSVSAMNSQRYSFKIEFDQYSDGLSYDGLDKLSLNNTIQDTTYMKDYLSYQLMRAVGVDAPLCSYAYITVNGEDWGLYLAVEGIEESYLERTKSSEGNLYKPDSMSMGGGRGEGKSFDMDEFKEKMESEESSDSESSSSDSSQQSQSNMPSFDPSNLPEGMELPEGFSSDGEMPSFDPNNLPEGMEDMTPPDNAGGGMGGFGMGSSDVKLQYSDDSISSYSNIFDSAVTDVTTADKNRLIQAIKTLNEGEDVESAVDVDAVIRYFVAHNFVVNSDSYTGMMVHNYYLYENDGKMSMIPWDYNLSFGTFSANDASSAVNDAIDSPLSASGDGDRPMFDFIVNNEEYLELYHQYMQEMINDVDFQTLIDETAELIAPYVEKDPTAFYTYDEFEKGVEALKSFCDLRVQSVQAQLDGTIASNDSDRSDSDQLIDTGDLNLSDMGTMNNGGGGNGGGFGGFGGGENESSSDESTSGSSSSSTGGNSNTPSAPPSGGFSGGTPPSGGNPPSGFTPPSSNNSSESGSGNNS